VRRPGRSAPVPRGSALKATVDDSEIERVFREQYGRAVAVLVRVCGDINLAEECVQDAFTVAVQRWPASGLPPSPAGWIITEHPAGSQPDHTFPAPDGSRGSAYSDLRTAVSRFPAEPSAYLLAGWANTKLDVDSIGAIFGRSRTATFVLRRKIGT
jgi:hypothetical protein